MLPAPLEDLFGNPEKIRKVEQLVDPGVGETVPGHVVERRVGSVGQQKLVKLTDRALKYPDYLDPR